VLEIVPGILEKEWPQIEEKINKVLPFAKTIQIDFIDGHFAPNITLLDPAPFREYADKVLLEAHLMVDEPINYIEILASAGFKRFIGHIERMSSQEDFLNKAKSFGEAGLAVDEKTSLEEVRVDFNFPDCFLLMTVNAGFSGQAFMQDALEKIKKLRQSTTKPIETDGGANREVVQKLAMLGVDRCVATSDLFKAKNISEEFQLLQGLSS
jgi:ribulose-phosphate 3-epimerase